MLYALKAIKVEKKRVLKVFDRDHWLGFARDDSLQIII